MKKSIGVSSYVFLLYMYVEKFILSRLVHLHVYLTRGVAIKTGPNDRPCGSTSGHYSRFL